MEKNYIYLGLPYMHDEMYIRQLRAEISDIVATDLMDNGEHVYAPISSWHHIATKYNLPGDWAFWAEMDETFIKHCDKLMIIKLKGWKKSTGVTAEIKLAKKYKKPVEFIDPTPYLKFMKKEN
jgi:hypothetical protein